MVQIVLGVKPFYPNQAQRRKRQRRQARDWAGYRFSQLQSSAKRRGIAFELTLDDFRAWYADVEKACTYCQLRQSQIEDMAGSMSIDRADNDEGYTADNIRLACTLCNMTKGAALTESDMIEIGPIVRRRLLQRQIVPVSARSTRLDVDELSYLDTFLP